MCTDEFDQIKSHFHDEIEFCESTILKWKVVFFRYHFECLILATLHVKYFDGLENILWF